MRAILTLGACGLALAALACQDGGTSPGAQPSAAPTSGAQATGGEGAPGELAAEVNGTPITTAELDQWIKDEWFAAAAASPSQLYELRSRSLDALVVERVLRAEAAKQGVSEEEVLRSRVEAVTDEEVQAFYEERAERLGGATLEDAAPRIREFMTSRREGQAREALREAADVVVHLEAPRVAVLATGPAKGPENARVTIVEFSDFECPFCRRVIPTLDAILEKYPNDVRVVYRNMPLRNHARARPAAEAALCADDQGQFWAYHDRLFENTRKLGDEDLLRYAEELNLDKEAFSQCYEEKRFAHQVDADLQDGERAGVSGTPAFFVNGILLSGAKPAEDFFRVIDAELERLDAEKG